MAPHEDGGAPHSAPTDDAEARQPRRGAGAHLRGAPAGPDPELLRGRMEELRTQPEWAEAKEHRLVNAAPNRAASVLRQASSREAARSFGLASIGRRNSSERQARWSAGAKVRDAEAPFESDDVSLGFGVEPPSLCWLVLRACFFFVLLTLQNIVVCICAAYLARSRWFDSWMNGTELKALSHSLAVTVPRCSVTMPAPAWARTNGTTWTGALFADPKGRLCGYF